MINSRKKNIFILYRSHTHKKNLKYLTGAKKNVQKKVSPFVI